MQKISEARLRNMKLKKNFPNMFADTKCVVKDCIDDDSQENLYNCKFLKVENEPEESDTKYEDLLEKM